ncbi:endoglucanase A-like [Bradysia coprophila]|uniref:endoglucanase A-like n=1 Tax=Bradysia coprophila TaxID=38358 RepID=UPI00187DBFBA|nr:endoglucanase A-like [Bradysia coprophila]
MKSLLSIVLVSICIYACNGQLYNYTEVIRLSTTFYQIQRQGRIADNHIPWRTDCFLHDGQDVGRDLSGGHFHAGDFTKFLFPYASFTTILNWGLLDWANGYNETVVDNAFDTVRRSLEYLMRMHPSPNLMYVQIGNGSLDHTLWDRCEDWPHGPRRTFEINETAPGSDIASEYAAAFASGYLIFNSRDATFGAALLQHAIDAYEFAFNFRGIYSESVPEAAEFYNSTGFNDDLGWGAVWLLRATNDTQKYKPILDRLWCEDDFQGQNPIQFSWDNKYAGVFILGNKVLAEAGSAEARYRDKGIEYCETVMNLEQTPLGLTLLDEWTPLRFVANAAFACLNLAEWPNITNATQYRTWAVSQLHYILGDTGRSYVIGFGENSPRNPHHRVSSCPPRPAPCGWTFFNSDEDNHFECTGAMVGGPNSNDEFEDLRQNWEQNDVGLDYNAGLQSSVAALNQLHRFGVIP